MSYSLQVWLGQQLREVAEDGATATKIALRNVDNGTAWNTWRIHHGMDAAALLEEMETVLAGLAEIMPTGRNPIFFVARDQNDCEVSTFPTFVLGKNKDKKAGDFMGSEASQSMAATTTAFAETFRQTLASVNAQIVQTMKHVEALQKTCISQTEYICALHEQKGLESAQRNEEQSAGSQLAQNVEKYAPLFFDFLGQMMAQKAPAASAAAHAAAQAAAAHAASNGVAPAGVVPPPSIQLPS